MKTREPWEVVQEAALDVIHFCDKEVGQIHKDYKIQKYGTLCNIVVGWQNTRGHTGKPYSCPPCIKEMTKRGWQT
jgi:hypothetical protein